jgi:hypothetical protein
MGVAIAVVLVAHLGAHLALVVGLARCGPVWRAMAAFVIPPLAPWWGWAAGMRRRTIVWGAALALYGIGVAVAGR